MLSVILAFSGAMIYGTSDFLGGIAARRWSAVSVTFVSSCVGLLVLLVCLLAVPYAWSTGVILWGALAGIAGVFSLTLLYACLAIGPMSILAPIMGLISATLPVVVGVTRGETLRATGVAGLVLGLAAIVLICLVPGARIVRPSPRGILLAVGSGVCVGLYLVFIDLSPTDSGPAPLVVTFAVSIVVTGGILAARGALRWRARGHPTAAGAGEGAGVGAGEGAGEGAGVGPAGTAAVNPVEPAAASALGMREKDELDAALIARRVADGDRRRAGDPIGARTRAEDEPVRESADPDPAPRMRPLVAAILAGLTDAPATIMFLTALRVGDLAVVSVLSALSPAGTVVLAAVLLRERIAPVQWLGLAAAVGAAALLSVP